jgi:hypothetical protein
MSEVIGRCCHWRYHLIGTRFDIQGWRTGEDDQMGWMGANQNSSRELGLYPEINPTPLSFNSAIPHGYRKAIRAQNRVRNRNENINRCWQEYVRDRRQNRVKRQLKSSQSFHRTPHGRELENTMWTQFKLVKLESFSPATQELYNLLPATIYTQLKLNRCQNSTLVEKNWNSQLSWGRCAPGGRLSGEVNHATALSSGREKSKAGEPNPKRATKWTWIRSPARENEREEKRESAPGGEAKSVAWTSTRQDWLQQADQQQRARGGIQVWAEIYAKIPGAKPWESGAQKGKQKTAEVKSRNKNRG